MVVELKPLPPKEAIDAFRLRGGELVETFSWQDAWQAEHATMFTVAKSAGFDILKDIQTALTAALSDGQTIEQFSRNLRPVLQAKGWWGRKPLLDPETGEIKPAQLGSYRRLQTIFDANMRVSYASGHWEGFERNRKTRPYLRYVAILDDRTRPAHRARHNLVLPVDHPYWNEWAPPCGWNCRCTLQSLSERDIKQLQADGEDLFFDPPQDTYRNFTNKRTGEIVRVPDGIDPGWAYNPGKVGYEAKVNQALAEKIADAPPQFVAAAVDERLSSGAFERFLTNPQGSMPVMAIPPEIVQAVGHDVRVALLSAETMAKQRRRHPELTAEDYRSIPMFGKSATLIVQDGAATFVLLKLSDGRWMHLAMKTTSSGLAAFVTSLRYTAEAKITALLKRDSVKIIVDRR